MTTTQASPAALSIDELQTLLQFKFTQGSLLENALTHKSFANEQTVAAGATDKTVPDNERLEFLGDAVLDLALSESLMKRFGLDPEGALSKKRASLVNEETLSKLAIELRLGELMRLGKGEAKTGGLQKPRILASTLEAIIGAIFLDAGYNAAAQTVEALFETRLTELGQAQNDFHQDFKTRLQEKTQEKFKLTPLYRVESETGPDHDKTFEVSVRVTEESLAIGTGRSKKAAEQDAARKALEKLMEPSV